jgi:hypothetical protein
MESGLAEDPPVPFGQLVILAVTYLALAVSVVFTFVGSIADQGMRDVFGLTGFYTVFGAPFVCLVLAPQFRRARAIAFPHQVGWWAALAYPFLWVALILRYFGVFGALA